MADPNLYDFPSPLKGYEGLEPLPEYVSLTIPLCSPCATSSAFAALSPPLPSPFYLRLRMTRPILHPHLNGSLEGNSD